MALGEDLELLGRVSSDSAYVSGYSDNEVDETQHYHSQYKSQIHIRVHEAPPIQHSWRFWRGLVVRIAHRSWAYWRPRPQQRSRRRCYNVVVFLGKLVAAVLGAVVLLIVLTGLFRPSYTHAPAHYRELEARVRGSTAAGRGNVNNEKVFIAASLYDFNGTLLGGEWGKAVQGLVHLLGPENVHLSIYENDPDRLGKASLSHLGEQLKCNMTLSTEHLPLSSLPNTTLPTGAPMPKRIAFLAEVRNRALLPLRNSPTPFDKLLFINDVLFNPLDAVQLLFSTNANDYGAACAVDFINAFKLYDTYATRDLEGYSIGVPFFPWFTSAGAAVSRADVLAQRDAVRVRSCWGGMTAFDASYFQNTTTSTSFPPVDDMELAPLRFRYEQESFWDASECCLIHADLTHVSGGAAGIYTNPYVRVAYDARTLRWLPFTRRFERLYSWVHAMINYFGGWPAFNPRRLEEAGEEVQEMVWRPSSEGRGEWDGEGEGVGDDKEIRGAYHNVTRIAGPGRFCERRGLSVMKLDPKGGEKKWMKVPLPEPPIWGN